MNTSYPMKNRKRKKKMLLFHTSYIWVHLKILSFLKRKRKKKLNDIILLNFEDLWTYQLILKIPLTINKLEKYKWQFRRWYMGLINNLSLVTLNYWLKVFRPEYSLQRIGIMMKVIVKMIMTIFKMQHQDQLTRTLSFLLLSVVLKQQKDLQRLNFHFIE